jgi:hypothetical protein
MLYRVKAEKSEWYLVRRTQETVIKFARRKLRGLPIGSEVTIFRGSERAGTIRNESLFGPEDPYPDSKNH